MSIAVIARVTIVPGKNEEFEAAFAVQARSVREDEPGNRLYQLARSREDPNSYIVMELYTDDAAIAAHREAPHMIANRPAMAPLIGAKTIVEIYDAL